MGINDTVDYSGGHDKKQIKLKVVRYVDLQKSGTWSITLRE